MISRETIIHIESPPILPQIRAEIGDVAKLAKSIERDGLRRPITVWKDGTLISGQRRLRAHSQSGYRKIPAVFVGTIEDAAKRLLEDNADEDCAIPLKSAEICRLWQLLRQLDAPAAARRLFEARRRGVELRKQTQNGERRPGRSRHNTTGDDYVFGLLGEAFGMSEATASRLWAIWKISQNANAPAERREQAEQSLAAIDTGDSSIWASYNALRTGRSVPSKPRVIKPTEALPAARQSAAWSRILPQMEGLTAGLTELGPVNSDLSWEQVGPVHARLMKVRRDLEKIIRNMKENAPS